MPERHEVPEEYRWRLEDIYASEAAWQQDYDEVKSRLPDLEAFQGKLGSSAETLLKALKLRDDISQKTGLLYAYAKMRKDENASEREIPGARRQSERALDRRSGGYFVHRAGIVGDPGGESGAVY